MNTIVFYSKTHNTERFIQKVLQKSQYSTIQITTKNCNELRINEDFVLLTPTLGFGKVPEEVSIFLKNNKENIKGVMGSGNRNWGPNFAKAALTISEEYNTPLIGVYELAGMSEDIQKLINFIEVINKRDERLEISI